MPSGRRSCCRLSWRRSTTPHPPGVRSRRRRRVRVAEPQSRWQALLVGVASSAHGDNPGFAQAVNSQEEFARVIERNMPGLHEDDLVVLPEPRYAQEVTAAIAAVNQAHDEDGAAGRVRPGLLFYFCG